MDLAAAQRILGKEGRVDRVDVRVAPGADKDLVRAAIATIAQGRATVHGIVGEASKARDLLSSLRVVLTLAGAISVVVGFFIIYHTVAVSLAERRRDLHILAAVGVSPFTIVLWLSTEAFVLGAIGAVVGACAGAGLATSAVALFGSVAAAWVVGPTPRIALTPGALVEGIALGIGTATVTMAIAARGLFRDAMRRRTRPNENVPHVAGTYVVGTGMLFAALVLLLIAPRTLPYLALVTFILTVNCFILAGLGLMSPAPASALGRAGTAAAEHLRGLALLFASGRLARNPHGPAAVVTAIVMALGWTIANASLIASFKSSWTGWVHDHYYSDLIVIS
jgi:putative ABC transport system permease protein